MAHPVTQTPSAPRAAPAPSPAPIEIPFKKVVLDNGLQVILHEDHSDPVVAVYVSYHVGSAREEAGKSGFAHLFEHMLFQGSQHVEGDGHFKMVSEAGGTLNGTTNLDRTLYFETLPSNQLELALWLEADRMGFLLPAMTQEKLDNQRDVVKNERRQNYENRPYGLVQETVAAALYPDEHPYHRITIGTMQDLTAASLEDVHAFFRRWYGPDNATLALGGDIDPDKALALVKQYFGSIPRGPAVAMPEHKVAPLDGTRRAVLEDQVTLPMLTFAWPGVASYSADDAALSMLAMVLSQNKSSVLDKALMVDEVLARDVTASNRSAEIAGQFEITVRAAPNVTLDSLEDRVRGLLAGLDKNGVPAEQLARMKARFESDFVRGFETVGRKTSSLAEYNTFLGDPSYAGKELAATMAVTAEDVRRVLRQYVLDRPCVILSVVPKGHYEMAASGRTATQLTAEKAIDRTKKPGSGPRPTLALPAVWHATLPGGLAVLGTRYAEVPVTTLALSVPAGRRQEKLEQAGIASLAAAWLNEGTAKRSTTELTDALDALGANLNVNAGDDEMTFSLTVLNKNLPAALELFGEVLLEPRYDAKDFERIKKQRLSAIDTRGDSITGMAATAWQRVLYGADSIDGSPSIGTRATIEKLTPDSVKAFCAGRIVPAGAKLAIVGDFDAASVTQIFAPLTSRWKGTSAPVAIAASAPAANGTARALFLVDKPGAAQSELRIGHLAVASTDPDFYPLSVLNYVLGGAFSSRINLNLREDKGYTYGARSSFSGGLVPGPFTASSAVRTDVTAESVTEVIKELEHILDGITDEELAYAKSALAQQMATQYESTNARRGMLENVARYGWPDDYPAQRLALLEKLGTADLKALAKRHIHPDHLQILVVGDKKVVGEKLGKLGLGPVVELDLDGNKLPSR